MPGLAPGIGVLTESYESKDVDGRDEPAMAKITARKFLSGA